MRDVPLGGWGAFVVPYGPMDLRQALQEQRIVGVCGAGDGEGEAGPAEKPEGCRPKDSHLWPREHGRNGGPRNNVGKRYWSKEQERNGRQGNRRNQEGIGWYWSRKIGRR